MSSYHLTELPYHPNTAILFDKIAAWDWAIFLDSCQPYADQGRYDILSARPRKTLVTFGHETTLWDRDENSLHREKVLTEDPWVLLKNHLENLRFESIPGLPFSGGALGYWGYGLGSQILHKPKQAENLTSMPDMAIGLYDWGIIIDHQEKTTWCFAQAGVDAQEWTVLLEYLTSPSSQINPISMNLPTHLQTSIQDEQQVLDSGEHKSVNFTKTQPLELGPTQSTPSPLQFLEPLKSNITKQAYGKAFERVKQHIYDGDCYQVNLAQCFSAKVTGDSWQTYQHLRQASPAPYAAFMRIPHGEILSLSPEQFLQVKQGEVQTKPIKGTRARSKDPAIDKLLAQELLDSEKDRAENVMIVDLLRNDLGRSCVPGSITVPALFQLESFPFVHHLVSTITGRLAPESNAIDLLQRCFPGGSITGAPKKRAMEIIAALEPDPRGIYCGAMGYIDHAGDMETNIIIRTLIICDNKLYCYAGGGLVADSHVEEEYQETFTKVSKILALISNFI